jgi:hypothetical protein
MIISPASLMPTAPAYSGLSRVRLPYSERLGRKHRSLPGRPSGPHPPLLISHPSTISLSETLRMAVRSAEADEIRRVLELEEALDAADPLRHLRDDNEHDDISSEYDAHGNQQTPNPSFSVVPRQPRSVRGETQTMRFEALGTAAISIDLAVDASPGCGG